MVDRFTNRSVRTRRTPLLRLGYVRLLDAAPLIVADHLGMFREAGLEVELSREVGWASIRDKLAFGELDVAQALSPMPFVMQLGIGVAKTQVISGMVLNCNGNAITLSAGLREEGVESGESLRRYVKKGYRTRKLVFGVVSKYSSHNFILCRWLEQHGIMPNEDVIISVLPPEQMVRNIAAQNIDGFCVGEPWNSTAIEDGHGWAVATSREISEGYPEKVLATTERFFSYNPEAYLSMIEVLLEACKYCSEPSNHSALLKILSKPDYLNTSPKTLSNSLSGSFPLGYGLHSEGPFVQFYGESVNCPDKERGVSVLEDLCRYAPHESLNAITKDFVSKIYRTSIYDQVARPVAS